MDVQLASSDTVGPARHHRDRRWTSSGMGAAVAAALLLLILTGCALLACALGGGSEAQPRYAALEAKPAEAGIGKLKLVI